MAKLTELEAKFLKRCPDGSSETAGVTLSEADGIIFLCPKCFAANGGNVGTHSVICWFEDKVADDVSPKPGRWNPVGTGLHDLTFVSGRKSNSVLLTTGCQWHGFITNGEAN